jgi:hypothetical protein
MRVSASMLQEWASSREAQGLLPVVIRRLIRASAPDSVLDFPGGDSVSSHGWDGEVQSANASPWVPAGASCWELSCQKTAKKKADSDFAKRTRQTPAALRKSSTLVMVTAQRWPGKKKWRDEKIKCADWHDVRVIDADQLEQWFEQVPLESLRFLEQLGRYGPGVETPSSWWDRWSHATNPTISRVAILQGRGHVANKLIDRVRDSTARIGIHADSEEEAVAYAIAALATAVDIWDEAGTLVVTGTDGWRFAAANPGIRLIIAASAQIASQAPLLGDARLIVPTPVARSEHRSGTHADVVELHRSWPQEFTIALTSMGLSRPEAERLTRSAGRSWATYRRMQSTFAATPPWLHAPEHAQSLTLLALLGSWLSRSPDDRSVVECVAGQPYERVEADLLRLAECDDPPVLRIGDVWLVKAPLELLYCAAGRIAAAQLDRFFEQAKLVLETKDPSLDLPDDDRWVAGVRGKSRPHSSHLRDSIEGSLVRLAVEAPDIPRLLDLGVEARVRRLVREVMESASAERWLSVHDLLPSFAEAAPEEFLDAVENSLEALGTPIQRLLEESAGNTTLLGRCWHSGLLWALEILAWNPAYLARTASILTALLGCQKSRWANSPLETLRMIFVPGLPQTTATGGQRLAVLDALIARDPESAWKLLARLVLHSEGLGMYSQRPRWRRMPFSGDERPTREEYHHMCRALEQRLVALAKVYPSRLAEALERIDHLSPASSADILDHVQAAKSTFPDSLCEEFRDALRNRIAWHRLHDKRPVGVVEAMIAKYVETYEHLASSDPVARHAWLFGTAVYNFPERVRGNYDRTMTLMRERGIDAIHEIVDVCGTEGVSRLFDLDVNHGTLGGVLAGTRMDAEALLDLFAPLPPAGAARTARLGVMAGLLRTLPRERSDELGLRLLERLERQSDARFNCVDALCQFPFDPMTWDQVDARGDETATAYWTRVSPGLWRMPADNWRRCVDRLLAVERPRTALALIQLDVKDVPTDLLTLLLNQFIASKEPTGPMPHGYELGEILVAIRDSSNPDLTALARLEFALFQVLDDDARAKSTLYAEIRACAGTYVELIRIVYRRHDRAPDPDLLKVANGVPETAWRVLREYRQIPGACEDGSIDAALLGSWLGEARRLSKEHDRLRVADDYLGAILAHAPEGADRVWPTEAVRDVLEQPWAADIRLGFSTEVFNMRGTTSRALFAGGEQERELAAHYRRHAEALALAHPQLSSTLESIARDFERTGYFEDVDAKLRMERCV